MSNYTPPPHGTAHIRAVYTRENMPRIAYLSCELSHLYDHGLYKNLIHSLRKQRTSISCRLYEQFAAYFPSYKRPYCNQKKSALELS